MVRVKLKNFLEGVFRLPCVDAPYATDPRQIGGRAWPDVRARGGVRGSPRLVLPLTARQRDCLTSVLELYDRHEAAQLQKRWIQKKAQQSGVKFPCPAILSLFFP